MDTAHTPESQAADALLDEELTTASSEEPPPTFNDEVRSQGFAIFRPNRSRNQIISKLASASSPVTYSLSAGDYSKRSMAHWPPVKRQLKMCHK